MVSIF